MSRESQVILLNRKFLYQIGNQEEKLLDFSKSIGLDLYDACIYNSRGLQFTKIGNTNQALIAFKKAIKLDPNCSDFYFDRGIFMKTQIMNNKAIELDPNNSEAYNKRGRLQYKFGNTYIALINYNKSNELDSNDTYSYNNRGNRVLGQNNQF